LILDLKTVKHDIEQWIVNFVEVPHPSLGKWPLCPYARQARLEQSYDVRLGDNPHWDLQELASEGLGEYQVVIFAYDPKEFSHELLSEQIESANQIHLLPNDLIALEDHPADPELVNGVLMNQGTYALAMVQSLSDLNHKAQLMARKGFYDQWPEDYLELLFKHREDPRK
jgi:hypothetical protein